MGEIFKNYYKRLAKEGFLKALLCGLTVGFTALLLAAALFWGFDWKPVWICAIVWAVFSAGATPIFYYKKFRPDKKAIARRIDELGLEERLLTMTELEGDDSFIARKQREDALAALETVNAGLLKLAVSVPIIVSVAVMAVLGSGMTTVSALSAADVIKSGKELFASEDSPLPEGVTPEYTITYEISDGEGRIVGELTQRVKEGEDSEPVVAIAADEWFFVAWSDGSEEPYRVETNVTKDLTVSAVFEPIDEGDDGDQEEEEEDEAPDKPQTGEDGKGGSGSQNDVGDGAGGAYKEINQVYDGETYYGGTVYDNAYSDVLEEISQNGDLSEEQKDVIDGYFDYIEK